MLPPHSARFFFFTSQAKRLFKETRGLGSAQHSHQESFFLTDLPGLPVSVRRASGSEGKAAVGSWLNRVQVKQA